MMTSRTGIAARAQMPFDDEFDVPVTPEEPDSDSPTEGELEEMPEGDDFDTED